MNCIRPPADRVLAVPCSHSTGVATAHGRDKDRDGPHGNGPDRPCPGGREITPIEVGKPDGARC